MADFDEARETLDELETLLGNVAALEGLPEGGAGLLGEAGELICDLKRDLCAIGEDLDDAEEARLRRMSGAAEALEAAQVLADYVRELPAVTVDRLLAEIRAGNSRTLDLIL